jgi:hypothetical protein
VTRHQGQSWILWRLLIVDAVLGGTCVFASPNRERWDELCDAVIHEDIGFTIESDDVLRHDSGGSITLCIPGQKLEGSL